jgi:predicted DNA-binding transcriptional regulator AlpA
VEKDAVKLTGKTKDSANAVSHVGVCLIQKSESLESSSTRFHRHIAFESLSDDALVDKLYVCHLFSCSVATVWRWSKDGRLPAPIKLGARTTRWRVGSLRSRLRSLSEGDG